jgi:hypothetical protein
LLRQINAARKGKVKGKLTDEGEKGEPLKLGTPVARVDVCLRDAEAEDGHGKSPNRAHPDLLGKEEVTYVVKNHGDQRDELQRRAVKNLYLAQGISPAGWLWGGYPLFCHLCAPCDGILACIIPRHGSAHARIRHQGGKMVRPSDGGGYGKR